MIKSADNRRSRLISMIIAAVIIFAVRLIYIKDLNGPIVFEDELGYWTHAANMNGLNWSNTLNMWYSFGYSLVLAPLFWFTHDMAILYKAGVVLNALFGVFGFLVGIKVLDKLTDRILPDSIKIIIAFTPMMYSGYLLQSNICWSETFLYTWTLITILAVCSMLDNPTVLNSFIAAFTLTFSFTIHNRDLVLLIAFALTLLVMMYNKRLPFKSLVTVILTMGVLFIGYWVIKDYLKAIEYNSDYILTYSSQITGDPAVEIYSADDFQGNNLVRVLDKMQGILQWSNIKALIKSILGSLWYLDVGSLGLSFLGICQLISLLVKRIKSKKDFFIPIFISLTFLGTIGLNSILHLSPQLTKDYNRLDAYFYGRYIDQISSVLIILGMLFLYEAVHRVITGQSNRLILFFINLSLFIHLISSFFVARQVAIQNPYFLVRTCAAAVFYKDNFDYRFYSLLGITLYLIYDLLVFVLYLINSHKKLSNALELRILSVVTAIFVGWSVFITYNNYADDTLANQKFRDLVMPAVEQINEDRSAPLYFYAGSDYYYLRSLRLRCVDNTFMCGIPDNISFMDGIDHAYFVIPGPNLIDRAFFPPGQHEFLEDNCTCICENQDHELYEYKAH